MYTFPVACELECWLKPYYRGQKECFENVPLGFHLESFFAFRDVSGNTFIVLGWLIGRAIGVVVQFLAKDIVHQAMHLGSIVLPRVIFSIAVVERVGFLFAVGMTCQVWSIYLALKNDFWLFLHVYDDGGSDYDAHSEEGWTYHPLLCPTKRICVMSPYG